SLLWSYPVGNLQIVLRKDAVYAAGPQNTKGVKLNYDTGEVLTTFPARRACTRATGCVDSIFFRASGGTVRVLTETNAAQHIAPMRPPCQDGVIVSNGHLYWGPWMCGCQLSLYGNIGLAPAPSLSATEDVYAKSLVVHSEDPVKKLAQRAGDWPAYRGDNARSDATTVALPGEVELQWTAKVAAGQLPTAPVAAGKMVFIADRSGAIRALDASGKEVWRQYAAGPVYYPPTIANDRVFVGAADGRVYAFEAVSGRPLWTFRVAPADRWIPVFDRLISAWPVAGGVVVKDGVVFAAAGITHYDGTYVVSLDAASGKLLERNTTSGSLAQEVNDGVSMQGVVKIVDNELRFLGGGVYETARYDLKSLRCLNEPKPQVKSQYRTAFYPYYPAYGKYVSLEYTCGDGNRLCHDASYEGSFFGNLGLHEPLPADATKEVRDEAREFLRRRGRTKATKPKYVWQDTADLRFTSFVVTPDHLLATGHPDKTPKKSFLALMSVKDGKQLWSHDLPADAVKGGAAVDADGRIYISLENGELRCYAAK
ncbi:MAG: PQQ-binding-like beta-propeller repeat protein, partial [Pirellulaceae bacterium]|nr:PQQ-binding-like beta-propeller repeat protein [Pirellulaceae bacterium]